MNLGGDIKEEGDGHDMGLEPRGHHCTRARLYQHRELRTTPSRSSPTSSRKEIRPFPLMRETEAQRQHLACSTTARSRGLGDGGFPATCCDLWGAGTTTHDALLFLSSPQDLCTSLSTVCCLYGRIFLSPPPGLRFQGKVISRAPKSHYSLPENVPAWLLSRGLSGHPQTWSPLAPTFLSSHLRPSPASP